MGCGAGVHRDEVTAFESEDESGDEQPKRRWSSRFMSRLSRRRSSHHDDPFSGENAIPDGIVLCSGKRPDWPTTDFLVFETKEHAEEALQMNHNSKEEASGRPYSPAHSTRSGKSRSDMSDQIDKGGKFFSKRQNGVGTWRIAGNVLYLVWPRSGKADTVLATKTPRQWVNAQTKLTLDVLEPKPDNPDWFTPDVIAEKFKTATVSSKAFECPVCYFELFQFPTGVIRLHSRRCCGHYFHKDCAQYLLRSMKGSGQAATCPLCGVDFSEVKLMPDLAENPRDWFATCDVDFGGELDAYEVVEALGCVLPVNRHKLEKNVKAHWHEWDPDGDGTITLQEFIAPVHGLRDWIMNNLALMKADLAGKPSSVPSIDRNPREWFAYWDRDNSGTLERDEVIRAIVRTFCRDDNGAPHLPSAHDMREITTSLWAALGYSAFDAINFEDFVRPFGLFDQFIHNQTNCAFFGMDAELIA